MPFCSIDCAAVLWFEIGHRCSTLQQLHFCPPLTPTPCRPLEWRPTPLHLPIYLCRLKIKIKTVSVLRELRITVFARIPNIPTLGRSGDECNYLVQLSYTYLPTNLYAWPSVENKLSSCLDRLTLLGLGLRPFQAYWHRAFATFLFLHKSYVHLIVFRRTGFELQMRLLCKLHLDHCPILKFWTLFVTSGSLLAPCLSNVSFELILATKCIKITDFKLQLWHLLLLISTAQYLS